MKKYLSILALIIVVALTVIQLIPNKAEALISFDTTKITPSYRVFDFFATSTAVSPNYGTSTSATSSGMIPYIDSAGRLDNGIAYLTGASKATFYFTRQGGNSGNAGSSVFKVQVTPDGTNWFDYAGLIQNQATSTSQKNTLNSVTLAGTSTSINSMDLTYDIFYGVRCIAGIVTDGLNFCKVSIGN